MTYALNFQTKELLLQFSLEENLRAGGSYHSECAGFMNGAYFSDNAIGFVLVALLRSRAIKGLFRQDIPSQGIVRIDSFFKGFQRVNKACTRKFA